MAQSLSSKLRDLRRSMKSKVASYMLFDFESIKLIARQMPQTKEELNGLIPESMVSLYGDKILEVTMAHGRDTEKFDDCVSEINAFIRGGLPGMCVLERVYPQILKHFGMQDEMEEVLDACKIYIHPEKHILCRRKIDEDD